jgi:hypothetical protein
VSIPLVGISSQQRDLAHRQPILSSGGSESSKTVIVLCPQSGTQNNLTFTAGRVHQSFPFSALPEANSTYRDFASVPPSHFDVVQPWPLSFYLKASLFILRKRVSIFGPRS